jgi:hypothetical protein
MKFMMKSLAFIALMSALPALGDEQPTDSSTDGFVRKMRDARGLVLRVAIDEMGRENTASTEIRLHTKFDAPANGSNLVTVWSDSESLANMPVLPKNGEITDASTYGWNNYYGNYWAYPYYYSNYYPYYYSYGNYYDWFYQPYYYSFGSYRYYYYPCY